MFCEMFLLYSGGSKPPPYAVRRRDITFLGEIFQAKCLYFSNDSVTNLASLREGGGALAVFFGFADIYLILIYYMFDLLSRKNIQNVKKIQRFPCFSFRILL